MLTFFLSTDTASPSRSATVSSSPSRVRYTTASNPLHSRKTATNTTKNRGSQGSRPIDVVFPSNDGHLNTFYFRTMGEKEKKRAFHGAINYNERFFFLGRVIQGGMIGSCFDDCRGRKASKVFFCESKNAYNFTKISKLHELRAALVERDAVDDDDGEV